MQVVQGLPGVRRQRGEVVPPPSHERHQLQPQQQGAGGGGAGPQTVHPAAVEQERGRAAAGEHLEEIIAEREEAEMKHGRITAELDEIKVSAIQF